MNNKSFADNNIFRCLAAVFFLFVIFVIPQQLEAQISQEAERAFKETKIQILKSRQDPITITLPLLSGGNVSLSSYKGKVVILNFWATWCPPCRAEMPSMETLYKRFKSQGLEILAVDLGERQDKVQKFINDNRYTFPVLLDSDKKVGSRYGVTAIPTTYILDREGKIIGRITGSIQWDDPNVIAAFEALLKS